MAALEYALPDAPHAESDAGPGPSRSAAAGKAVMARQAGIASLKYIEENVLQAPRSVEEVPGYEIPYLYFDYLRTGDARPLKGVFYHNAMDVVAMAALLSHTASMLADPFRRGDRAGLDVIAMAKLSSTWGIGRLPRGCLSGACR